MATTYTLDRSYSLEKVSLELPERLNNVEGAPNMFTIYENSELRNSVKSSNDKDLSLFLVVNEVVLFHSIDEISNSGYITITDAQNLIQTLPLFGWERVHIKFSISNAAANTTVKTDATPEEAGSSDATNSPYDIYERYFYVYAIDNIKEAGDHKIYTIRFTSLATLINISTRLEKRYTGKAEDILDEISNIEAFKLENLPKYICVNSDDHPMDKSKNAYNTCFPIRYNVESEFEHDVVCPAWRPFSFIRNIVEKSVSKNGLFTDCFLFQQTDGVYEFTSYQQMVNNNNSEIVQFYYLPWTNNSTSVPTTNEKYTIKSYTMTKLFDVQMQCVTGTTGGITKVLDFATGMQQDFVLYYTPVSSTGDSALTQLTTYESPSSLVKGEKEQLNIATAGGKVADVIELNINSVTDTYKMTKNAASMLTAYKQSPFERIRVKITGADETSFDKNRRRTGSPESAMFTPDRKDEIQKKYAMNEPANAIMRISEVIFEMNPCTDLKLGQCILIDMESTSNTEPMLNGYWYISNIKYVLTYSDIKVYVTCFRNNMVITGE